MKTTYKTLEIRGTPQEELTKAIKSGMENKLGNSKEADVNNFIAKHNNKGNAQSAGMNSDEIYKNLAESATKYKPRMYQRLYFWMCQQGLANPLNKYQKKLKLIDSLVRECEDSMTRTERKMGKYRTEVQDSEKELKTAKQNFQTVENFISYYTKEKEKQILDRDTKKEQQEVLQETLENQVSVQQQASSNTKQQGEDSVVIDSLDTEKELDEVEKDYHDLVTAIEATEKLLDDKHTQQIDLSDIIIDESDNFSKNYSRLERQENKCKNLKLRKKKLLSARDDIEDYVDCHSNGDIYDINLLIRADSALDELKQDTDELDEMTGEALSKVLYSNPIQKDQTVLDIEELKKKQYQGSHDKVEIAKKIISKF